MISIFHYSLIDKKIEIFENKMEKKNEMLLHRMNETGRWAEENPGSIFVRSHSCYIVAVSDFHLISLAHMSWKLKSPSLIACRPSSICPFSLSVYPSVHFSHFHLFLSNFWATFNQTWHPALLGKRYSILFKWRAKPFYKGNDYKGNEIAKIYWTNLIIYFILKKVYASTCKLRWKEKIPNIYFL